MSEPDDLAMSLLMAAMQVGESGARITDFLPPPDPAEALRLAATGDLMALRFMAGKAYDGFVAFSADEDVSAMALSEALTFARIAATQGHEHDSEVLVFLYCKAADWHTERGRQDIGTRFEAAGLNLASALADAGREDFAEMITIAGEVLSAETFAEAKRQRQEKVG